MKQRCGPPAAKSLSTGKEKIMDNIDAVLPPEPVRMPRPIDVTVTVGEFERAGAQIIPFEKQADGSWLELASGPLTPGNPFTAHPNPNLRWHVRAPDIAAGSKGVSVNVFIENSQKFRCIVWQYKMQEDGGWKRSKLATANPEDEDMLFYADAQTRIEAEHQDI
jgi:hypothetical protein